MSERSRGASGALLLGCCAAAVWALPAALRASNAGVGFVSAFFALAGASAVIVAPLVVSVRSLEARAFRVPLVGIATALLPLCVFAALLKERTHHRQLGAVAFTLVSACIVMGAVLLVRRALSPKSPPWVRGCAVGVALLSAVICIAWLSPGVAVPSVRHALLDAGIGGLLVAGTVSLKRAVPPLSGRLALPLWGALVLGAFFLLWTDSALRSTLSAQAPVVLGAGNLLAI